MIWNRTGMILFIYRDIEIVPSAGYLADLILLQISHMHTEPSIEYNWTQRHLHTAPSIEYNWTQRHLHTAPSIEYNWTQRHLHTAPSIEYNWTQRHLHTAPSIEYNWTQRHLHTAPSIEYNYMIDCILLHLMEDCSQVRTRLSVIIGFLLCDHRCLLNNFWIWKLSHLKIVTASFEETYKDD